jgi:hypothetical protein
MAELTCVLRGAAVIKLIFIPFAHSDCKARPVYALGENFDHLNEFNSTKSLEIFYE